MFTIHIADGERVKEGHAPAAPGPQADVTRFARERLKSSGEWGNRTLTPIFVGSGAIAL
jgi:hypothetical protein